MIYSFNLIQKTKYFCIIVSIACFLCQDVVMANDNSCVSVKNDGEQLCISRNELDDLKKEVNGIDIKNDARKMFNLLKDYNLGDDGSLRLSRGFVYLFQKEPLITLCDAVNDLEHAAAQHPSAAISVLDALYHGGWSQIASFEGSILARIKLVESRLNRSRRGDDTTRKLNEKLFFSNLLSFLEVKDRKKLSRSIADELTRVQHSVLEEIKKDNLKILDLKVIYIEPRQMICQARARPY